MTYFTNSPFERMMQQKPMGGRETCLSALPKSHRCYGCSSYGRACFGLIIKPKPKEGGTTK